MNIKRYNADKDKGHELAGNWEVWKSFAEQGFKKPLHDVLKCKSGLYWALLNQ